jgi:hypothetical protein
VIGAAIMVAKIATGEIEDKTSPVPNRAKGGAIGGKRRDGDCAKWFIDDLAARLANRVQFTTEAYLEAVEGAFATGEIEDKTSGPYKKAAAKISN